MRKPGPGTAVALLACLAPAARAMSLGDTGLIEFFGEMDDTCGNSPIMHFLTRRGRNKSGVLRA